MAVEGGMRLAWRALAGCGLLAVVVGCEPEEMARIYTPYQGDRSYECIAQGEAAEREAAACNAALQAPGVDTRDRADLYFGLAVAEARDHRPDLALQAVNSGLALVPHDGSLLTERGGLYLDKNDTIDARRDF